VTDTLQNEVSITTHMKLFALEGRVQLVQVAAVEAPSFFAPSCTSYGMDATEN